MTEKLIGLGWWGIFAKLWLIAIAGGFGFGVYKLLLKPHVTDKLCLTNGSACTRIVYLKYNNAVLVQMPGSGYWIFFDGVMAFVYGVPTGRQCGSPFVPAYVVDLVHGNKVMGYECVQPVSVVRDFFVSSGALQQVVFVQEPAWDFDAVAVLDLLASKGVIAINRNQES